VPFYFQGQNSEEWVAGSGLDEATVAQFKKLVYPSGRLLCFSDKEVMMRALPDDKQRLAFMKAISRQPAVLAQVRVRPDTDVAKYGNNVNQPWTTMRMKDLAATYDRDDATDLYFYRRKDR